MNTISKVFVTIVGLGQMLVVKHPNCSPAPCAGESYDRRLCTEIVSLRPDSPTSTTDCNSIKRSARSRPLLNVRKTGAVQTPSVFCTLFARENCGFLEF